MAPKTRLDVETQTLSRYFPQFKIQDPFGPRAGVIGRITTNRGNQYVVWLALGAFPNDAPRMYIIAPEHLTAYDGRTLGSFGADRSMHLLPADEYGHPQICHYNDQFWHPNVTLYKIVMKARFWLEAYEQHLKHGKPIDAYLPHME